MSVVAQLLVVGLGLLVLASLLARLVLINSVATSWYSMVLLQAGQYGVV